MLGILVELALSWIIVWIVEKKNLTVLGLNATAPRLKGFTLFFFIATVGCLVETFLRIGFFKEHYVVNPKLSFMLVLKGLWWNMKCVV